jgi:hypothetical protein
MAESKTAIQEAKEQVRLLSEEVKVYHEQRAVKLAEARALADDIELVESRRDSWLALLDHAELGAAKEPAKKTAAKKA